MPLTLAGTSAALRSPPEQVDRTIEVPLPPDCPECLTPLGEAPVTLHDQYQIDLPEPKPLIVTEHRAYSSRCAACGAPTRAAFPE